MRPAVNRALIILGVVLPGVAWAQSATTGAIAGDVRDTTGAVLPGVTVEASSPALIEKTRTVVTDDQGRYQIVELRPGRYTVTYTLAGFSTVRRENLDLNTGVTLPVNAELRVGSLEETVTVSGASPVVDVQNVRTQNVLNREELRGDECGDRAVTRPEPGSVRHDAPVYGNPHASPDATRHTVRGPAQPAGRRDQTDIPRGQDARSR